MSWRTGRNIPPKLSAILPDRITGEERSALLETRALRIVRRWHATGIEAGRHFLVLQGPTGCGKSLAAAWAVSMPPTWRCPWPSAWATRIVPSHLGWGVDDEPALVPAIEIGTLAGWTKDDWRRLEHAALLAVDDLGLERTEGLDNMHRLIDARYRAGVPTVITTNLSNAEIKTRYGDRVMSRFLGCGLTYICAIDGMSLTHGEKRQDLRGIGTPVLLASDDPADEETVSFDRVDALIADLLTGISWQQSSDKLEQGASKEGETDE